MNLTVAFGARRLSAGRSLAMRHANSGIDCTFLVKLRRWRDSSRMSDPAINLDNLSPDQRLRLIEELWESLSKDPGNVPLTVRQRDELDWRLDEIESGQAEGIPWDDVLRRIRRRAG